MTFRITLLKRLQAGAAAQRVFDYSKEIQLAQGCVTVSEQTDLRLRRCVNQFNVELTTMRSRYGATAVEALLRSTPLDRTHRAQHTWKQARIQVLADKRRANKPKPKILGLRLSGTLHEQPYRLVVWLSRDGKQLRAFSGFCSHLVPIGGPQA